MARAPGPVGVVFGVALAVGITLTGPLLLFNPWFTSMLQARHEVAASFATDQARVDRVTGEILGDLYVGGDFDAALVPGEPLLDERERSHMGDVSGLVQLLAAIAAAALVLCAVCGAWLRGEPRRQGRILLVSAGAVGAAAILLAVTFAVAFEPAFLAFHAIFFPPGTYLFSEGSNLIELFPEPFWFEAALAAGVAVIATALLATLIGFGRWRAGRTASPPGLI